MLVRLDKWLSEKSSFTRSEAKDAMKKGKVLVNGQAVKDPSLKLNTEADEVILDGNKLIYEENVYFVLNKPAGFVTSTSDSDGVNVMSLLKGEVTKNLFPVGRLDKDTEGLLLITDDGELAHRLLSPKKHVKKTYYVECQNSISDPEILSVTIGLKLKRIVATTDYMLADRFGRIELMSRHRSHLPMDFQSVASCLNYIGNFMKSPQVMVIFLFYCTTNRPPLEADSKICDCLF